MENYYDVAVVGGGPVGLMTACELAIQGVKVVVLERRLTWSSKTGTQIRLRN